MSIQGSPAEEVPAEEPQVPRVPDLAVTIARLARLAPTGKAELMNNIALHFDRLAAAADLQTPLPMRSPALNWLFTSATTAFGNSRSR